MTLWPEQLVRSTQVWHRGEPADKLMITMKSKEDSLTLAIASPICTNLSRYPMAILRLSGELGTELMMESTVPIAARIERWETVSSFCTSNSKRSMFISELSIAGPAVSVAVDGLGCSLGAMAAMDSLTH